MKIVQWIQQLLDHELIILGLAFLVIKLGLVQPVHGFFRSCTVAAILVRYFCNSIRRSAFAF